MLTNLDGFILTHVKEPVEVPSEPEVSDYLPDRYPHATLDPSNPKTMGPVARPEHWTETRYAVHDAMVRSKEKIAEATEAFADQFGRRYDLEHGGLLETLGPTDAELALVGLGSITGTIQHVIENRSEAVKLVRPRVIRPFPAEALRDALAGTKAVGVLQKEVSPGYQGSFVGELKSALYASDVHPVVKSYVIGLGGRDVRTDEVGEILADVKAAANNGHIDAFAAEESWPQLKHELLDVPDDVESEAREVTPE